MCDYFKDFMAAPLPGYSIGCCPDSDKEPAKRITVEERRVSDVAECWTTFTPVDTLCSNLKRLTAAEVAFLFHRLNLA